MSLRSLDCLTGSNASARLEYFLSLVETGQIISTLFRLEEAVASIIMRFRTLPLQPHFLEGIIIIKACCTFGSLFVFNAVHLRQVLLLWNL